MANRKTVGGDPEPIPQLQKSRDEATTLLFGQINIGMALLSRQPHNEEELNNLFAEKQNGTQQTNAY